MNDLNSFGGAVIYIIGVIGYILIAWSKNEVDDLFDSLIGEDDDARHFFPFFRDLFQNIATGLDPIISGVFDLAKSKSLKSREEVVNHYSANTFPKTLQTYANNFLQKVTSTEKPEHTTWRILGAVIYLLFFVIFIYADFIQGINNLSGIEAFSNIQVAPMFQELWIPIIVSSVLSMIALAMVFFDLIGLTYLAPWDRIKNKFVKGVFIVIVILTLILTIGIAVTLSFGKFPVLASNISPARAEAFKNAAVYAQSLVIVPMLVTTFLLFWGVAGFPIIYIFFIWCLVAIYYLLFPIVWISSWLTWLLIFIICMIFIVILITLKILFATFGILIQAIIKTVTIIQKLIDLFAAPGRKIFKGIQDRVRQPN